MAAALHFSGACGKVDCSILPKSSLHGQAFRFRNSVAVADSRNFRNVKFSCTTNSHRIGVLKVSCESSGIDLLEKTNINASLIDSNVELGKKITCVMKFGGSSLASAERMREVADLILSFPDERPIIVLSAMGKTTNKLLMAGEKAVCCGVTNVDTIDELSIIKELHLRTVEELEVEKSIIATHLEELEQLLKGIAMMKELTPRTKDYLSSFGECMSTRIFAAYLNKIGAKARQYDAFDIGFITTDDFTNADILEATYPAVAQKLSDNWTKDSAIPIVTGFLGKVFLHAKCPEHLVSEYDELFELKSFRTALKDAVFLIFFNFKS